MSKNNRPPLSDKKRIEQLEQEKAVAEKTAARMKALAGTIAHQLNNPLAGIKMLFNTLRQLLPVMLKNYRKAVQQGVIDADPPLSVINTIEQSLLTAEQRIHHAEHTIAHQLMNLKANHHYMALDKRDLERQSMIVIIEKVLADYPFIPSEKKRVHWLQGDDFEILAERHLIVNVINNLIDNALYSLRESSKTKGKIEIWLADHTVHIKDNGLGLDSDTCKKLFRAFHSTRNKGMGLGLSFCQSVMDAHFGAITAQGRAGQTAHFSVRFPTPAEFLRQQKKSARKYLGDTS